MDDANAKREEPGSGSESQRFTGGGKRTAASNLARDQTKTKFRLARKAETTCMDFFLFYFFFYYFKF